MQGSGWISDVAFLVALATALYMAGLIAFVHFVHYPLFERVGGDGFEAYHAGHVARTTWVVAGPMIAELASAIVLVIWPRAGVAPWLAWTGLAASLTTWGITALASVPSHDRLARGFDAREHRRLLVGDAVRLVAWWCHAGVMLAMAATR